MPGRKNTTSPSLFRVESIKTLYQLWANENNVKTQKLTMFFTAQSILASAFTLSSGGKYLIPAVGMAISLFWFFSIGRTVAFQKIWKEKIDRLLNSLPKAVRSNLDFYPSSEDKTRMPFYAKMSGKHVLLWPPAAGLLLWMGILLYMLFFHSHQIAVDP